VLDKKTSGWTILDFEMRNQTTPLEWWKSPDPKIREAGVTEWLKQVNIDNSFLDDKKLIREQLSWWSQLKDRNPYEESDIAQIFPWIKLNDAMKKLVENPLLMLRYVQTITNNSGGGTLNGTQNLSVKLDLNQVIYSKLPGLETDDPIISIAKEALTNAWCFLSPKTYEAKNGSQSDVVPLIAEIIAYADLPNKLAGAETKKKIRISQLDIAATAGGWK